MASDKILKLVDDLGLIPLGNIDDIRREVKIDFIDSFGYKYNLDSGQLIRKVLKPFHIFNPYCKDNFNLYFKENNKNIEVIDSPKSKDVQFKLKCKECGYEWFVKSSTILRLDTGCAKCMNKLALTIEEVKIKSKQIHKNIEIIGGEYKNCDSKLHCLCTIHNYEFYKSWDKLKQGKAPCLMCQKELNSGENNHMWRGGLTDISTYLRDFIKPWWLKSGEESDFKCILTGVKETIEIHHVNKCYSEILYECLDELNLPIKTTGEYSEVELRNLESLCLSKHYEYGLGIVLHKDIHQAFHIMYGYGSNTKQQFYEFLKYVEEVGNEEIINMYKEKRLPVICESKMITNCKRRVKCNETGEVFDSISELVRKYGKEYKISSPTIVKHIKHGGKFRCCPYTFSYFELDKVADSHA